MKFINRRRRQAPTVIIISLIDVLIVMLIFMMVTTTFKQQPTLRLALPESKHAKEGSSETSLIVTLSDKEPFYYIGTRPVTLENLYEVFSTAAKTNPQVSLAIRPDQNAPLKTLVNVMGAAKEAGITNLIDMFVKKAQK